MKFLDRFKKKTRVVDVDKHAKSDAKKKIMPLSATSSKWVHITNNQQKELINEIITPLLENAGFTYDGKYSWYSSWNNHMRKVISLSLMKGYGILSWGVAFDFLPKLSKNRLTYERSDKNIKRHLYDYPKPFVEISPAGWNGHHFVYSLIGSENDLKEQYLNAFKLSEKDIFNWFSKIVNLEKALVETERQIAYGKYYKITAPSRDFIRAYLLSATGRYTEGNQQLEVYFQSMGDYYDDDVKEKAFKRLQKVADKIGVLINKYHLKFWFEHGGICIWGANEKAKNKYGYAIEQKDLPISAGLIRELNDLEDKYVTFLDWEYPPNPSPWSEEQKHDFLNRATIAYEKLKAELGTDYEVENNVATCLY